MTETQTGAGSPFFCCQDNVGCPTLRAVRRVGTVPMDQAPLRIFGSEKIEFGSCFRG
jgi:hypothetical protein